MAIHSSILAWRITMVRGAWRATVHGVAYMYAHTLLNFMVSHIKRGKKLRDAVQGQVGKWPLRMMGQKPN